MPSAFTAAAGRLEGSYQQLQNEVARLREELEERNAALGSSLAENERMRVGLSCILEALPSGVIVLESNGEVGFVNPEARRMLETNFLHCFLEWAASQTTSRNSASDLKLRNAGLWYARRKPSHGINASWY